MKFICPLIVVESLERSRFLYRDILKQKVKADYGENITFYGDFAIHLKSHFKGLIDNREIIPKSNNFELYFEDDKLEEIQIKLETNGFEFIHKIVEQPWKQRVLRFYDYDKNIVEIGERLEHVAYRLSLEGLKIDEISKITYLAADVVRESILEYSKIK